MTNVLLSIILGLLGLVFGSFAGAQVWRLRARQLREDKAAGEPVDKDEFAQLSKLSGKRGQQDRSVCLHCSHQLAWYDLVPIVSWLSTGGKCRYCHTFIGWFEPLIELGTAALFVVSYIFWNEPLQAPLAIVQFGLWLVACVGFAILFAYDFKWLILPDRVAVPLIIVAALSALCNLVSTSVIDFAFYNLLGAVAILSGLYLLLWWLSKGRWVGFGDVKLGLALGLLLGDYQLAFIALLAANLIGCLIVLVGFMTKRLQRGTHMPLGPLLIVGAIIAQLYGPAIVTWYMSFVM